MSALIGLTLGRYFALRFLRTILGVFLTVFTLVYTLDFVELLRRAGDAEGAYRVGESRSNYSSVVRRDRTAKPGLVCCCGTWCGGWCALMLLFLSSFELSHSGCNTPRLALGAGGALVSLPWLDRRERS